VTRFFPITGEWTREAFAKLCRAIVDAGHMALPAEDTMRSCRFCTGTDREFLESSEAVIQRLHIVGHFPDIRSLRGLCLVCLKEEQVTHTGLGIFDPRTQYGLSAHVWANK